MGKILPKGYAIAFECNNLNEMPDLFICKNGNGTTVFEVHAVYFSVKNFVFPLKDSVLAVHFSLLHYWFRRVLSIANQKNLQKYLYLGASKDISDAVHSWEKLQGPCTNTVWKYNYLIQPNVSWTIMALFLSELLNVIKTYYPFHNPLLKDEIESYIVVSVSWNSFWRWMCWWAKLWRSKGKWVSGVP